MKIWVALVASAWVFISIPLELHATVPPSELRRLAAQAERRGNWSLALEHYAQAVRADPSDSMSRSALRRVLLRKCDVGKQEGNAVRRRYVRDAARRWETSREKRKEWSAQCRRGDVLLRKKKYVEASDLYNRVLDEFPGFPPAVRGIARLQKKGTIALKRGKFPTPRHAQILEGVLAYIEADWERAARLLDENLASGDVPSGLGSAHLPEYRTRALARFEEKKAAAEHTRMFEQAVGFYQQGRLNEARDLFRQILAHRSHAESEAYLRAIDSLQTAVDQNVREKLTKEEISDRMMKGSLFSAQGKYMESLEEFARVLELDPGNTDARVQFEEVKRTMKETDLFVPGVPVGDESESRFREGLRLYGNEDYQEALAVFEEVLRLNPQHHEAEQAASRVRRILSDEGKIQSER